MPIIPLQIPQKQKQIIPDKSGEETGSVIGSLLGMLAVGGAAVMTGGASLAAIPAITGAAGGGMALGGGLGRIVGKALSDGSREVTSQAPVPQMQQINTSEQLFKNSPRDRMGMIGAAALSTMRLPKDVQLAIGPTIYSAFIDEARNQGRIT